MTLYIRADIVGHTSLLMDEHTNNNNKKSTLLTASWWGSRSEVRLIIKAQHKKQQHICFKCVCVCVVCHTHAKSPEFEFISFLFHRHLLEIQGNYTKLKKNKYKFIVMDPHYISCVYIHTYLHRHHTFACAMHKSAPHRYLAVKLRSPNCGKTKRAVHTFRILWCFNYNNDDVMSDGG